MHPELYGDYLGFLGVLGQYPGNGEVMEKSMEDDRGYGIVGDQFITNMMVLDSPSVGT